MGEKVAVISGKDCINCGDCIRVCDGHIIEEGDNHPVVKDSCTGCRKCLKACLVGAIKMQAVSSSVAVCIGSRDR